MKGECILEIDTEDFCITFLGPLPNKGSFVLKNFDGGKKVDSGKKELLNIEYKAEFDTYPLLKVVCNNNTYKSDDVITNTSFTDGDSEKFLPLFFENIQYNVHLSSKNGMKYTLFHEHSSISNGLSYFEKHNTFSGTINFRNNVGVTEFELREENRTILKIIITVFSIKVDFLIERDRMIHDLNTVHNKLIYELFNPTKSTGGTEHEIASGLEWLVSFYHLSNEILKTIKRIEKKNHNSLINLSTIKDVEKISRPNKSYNKQINKYGKREVLQKRKIEIDIKKSESNSLENGYIKYLMNQIINLGDKWLKHLSSSGNFYNNTIKSERIYLKITGNLNKIRFSYNNTFWKEIDINPAIRGNKSTYLFHGEFVLFEKLYKLLNKAIDLQLTGSRYIYTLSMEELYEFWTFYKLTELIGGIITSDENAFSLKVLSSAFNTVLKKGQPSQIKVTDDITIATNRLFTRNEKSLYFSPFVNQQPDLVFEIKTKHRLNILDAKYKINVIAENGGEQRQLKNKDLISNDLSDHVLRYLPKDEDINTMHRYRDAIKVNSFCDGTSMSSPAVDIGIILYPHKPDLEGETAMYLNRLKKYKIGAIPLSPGIKDHDWLSKYKSELISSDPLMEQVRILANVVSEMIDDNE